MLRPEVKLISVDDHLIEPPNLWLDRLPSHMIDQAPRIVENEAGGHSWLFAGKLTALNSGLARVKPDIREEDLPTRTDGRDLPARLVRFDQIRPGSYDPLARLADMDEDGVWAQLLFPQFARFAGHRFLDTDDLELRIACVRAYNDFLLDEWCAAAPDRYVGMSILPFWDVEAAVAEVHRTVEKGARCIAFSENPTLMGFPSIHTDHWTPLWEAVSEADVPLCLHIGSGSKMVTSSADAPGSLEHVLIGLNSAIAAADWLFSGIFERFANLKIVLSEGGAGWVPHIRERSQLLFERRGSITGATRSPNELYEEHVYVCMVGDAFASSCLEDIGVDNIMWESDYPHDESWWPNSRSRLEALFADVPDDVAEKVGAGNARRIFNVPEESPAASLPTQATAPR